MEVFLIQYFCSPLNRVRSLMQSICSMEEKVAVLIIFLLFFAKLAVPVVSEPFSELDNHSITVRIFPEVLKLSKVVPVYKSGSRHNPTHYRPILLLPCFAKIFGNLLFKRLDVFIRKHSIIAATQYGFKPGLSTLYAVTDVLTLFYDNKLS